jgi:CheY-like chemotaxis protein
MNTITINENLLRVLIVDDNRDGADALGLLLEELGHQVHVTYGGRQALEVVSAFQPDLMLVDLLMPDVDGFSLVARLRQSPALAETTIVAITGKKDIQHRIMALKVGCDGVLVKPAALVEIKAVLASVVRLTGKPK